MPMPRMNIIRKIALDSGVEVIEDIDVPIDEKRNQTLIELIRNSTLEGKDKMSNLYSELLAQIDRVRDEVIPEYVAIGPAGAVGKILLEQNIAAGKKAIASGDVVGMVTALHDLRGCK